MKKIVCIILVIAMMLGFAAMLAVETFATSYDVEVDFDDLKDKDTDTTVIDQLTFVLPALIRGETIPQSPNISVNNGNVSCQTRWGDALGNVTDHTAFQGGQKYWMTAVITANEGFAFSDNVSISYTGDCKNHSSGVNADKTQLTVSFEVECPQEEIKNAQISLLPEQITAGAAQVPAVSAVSQNIQVTGVRWVDANKQTVTAFQNGKDYFLEVTVKPGAGYVLANGATIYAENKQASETVRESAQLQKVYFRYSLPTTEVALTVSALEVGKLPTITIPENANYILVDSAWGQGSSPKMDENMSNVDEVEKLVNGKYAFMAVQLKPKDGYTLSADVVFSVNGKEIAPAWVESVDGQIIAILPMGRVGTKTNLDAPLICVSMDETLGKAVISWEAVEGAKSYEIWRATSENGKYTRIATNKASVTTYTDKYAAVGTKYFYKVKTIASSSKLNSDYSNIVSATAVCAQAKLTVKLDAATGKPVISWDKVDGAQNYWLLRRVAGSDLSYDVISRQSKLTYTDTTAQVDVEYEYILDVIGKEPELDGKVSASVFVVCGMAKPVVKGGVNDQGNPRITWEAVEGAVKYDVYRSTKSGKGYTIIATVTEGTSYDDVAAEAGKTFYYQVKAVGEKSESVYSAYVKLVGKCATPQVVAENAASGKPKLTWQKVPGAKQYTIYRASSENGKYSKLGTSKTNSYEDKKASSGKTFYYKVVANASKATFNSEYSAFVSCNVICGTPSVTVKIDAATGKPSLSWKKVDAAAGYRIFRKLPGEENFAIIAEQTGVTFVDTTAPIDTLCTYMVQTMGKSAALDGTPTKALSATSAIARPKLNAGVNSEGKPCFDWAPVEGAVKYEIYRSTKSGKGYTLIATLEDGNAYVDETVAGGKTFYYKVKAVGNVSSAESAEVKLTGKCAAPWISIALNETSGKPVISWQKVSGAKQYTVYRATSEDGKYTKVGTSKTTTFTDSKAVPGTQYFYKVVANGSKSAYDSIYSNIEVATGYAAAPQVTLKNDSKGKPVVSWKKISEAQKYMVVYVDVTDVEKEEDITEQFILENMQYVEVSKKNTSVTLTKAQTGRIYMVFVVAVPANEDYSGVSLPSYVASTCAAPKISGKYLQGYNCGTWKAVEGAEYYAIYRSTKKSSGYELLGYIDNDSSFVDLSAVKGKTYYYKVTACTDYTESDFSNVIKLKTK